ncbi:hypothetical protein BKA62DRAFT_693856 [Auriculariales sp. MPI-PUGE-AT-0066]|nr:hypothetical protein BKA62DRAFT_693856 [Auriculariales sp. MPI-PUGE-AT-0066]
MTKHSKNNTASSVFSYAEYKKLDYGTKRQRLGNESMRRFDACALCCQTAREPVACPHGHLFCKECVFTDLLTQKTQIKRAKDSLAALHKQEEEEREAARIAARERVLQEFERGQLSVGKKIGEKTGIGEKKQEGEEPRGLKRKFEFDADAVEDRMRDAEEEALRAIEREQAEARKAKLPDFWLPSLMPDAAPTKEKEQKERSVCKASEPAHPLALKHLIPVTFTAESSTSTSTDNAKMCPSCKKALSNNTFMFVMKPCSHVVCKTCVDELVRPASSKADPKMPMACVVCDAALKDKDLVELKREGTGFAGGGLAEARKKGVAFQG